MIVDLSPTEEQQLIDDSVRALLARRLPVERLREPGGQRGAGERAAWDELVELGIFGLGLSEAQGGIGYGLPEEAIVARALGAHLASPVILAQMIAVHLANDKARPAFMSGRSRAAFASALDGRTAHLIDGGGASHMVLLSGAGIALAPAAALEASDPFEGIDETVFMSRLSGRFPDLSRTSEADRLSLLFAAYLVGLAEAACDMAVAYAGTREQFGQPIGAFQAIKHMCADMAVRAAGVQAQAFHAAILFGHGQDDGIEVACARLLASDAALGNAKANLQIHGAMGFTAECDAHLFLKRAHLLSMTGSSRRAEQARILGRM